jgi:hypothetical protein
VNPAGPLRHLAAGALPGERVHEAAAQVLADEALQRALPAPVTPSELILPPDALVLLVRLLLAATLLVLVVLAAVWLARRLAVGGRDATLAGDAPGRGAAIHIPTGGARAMAAAGRFGEAIHLLLLETLEALSRAARLSPALTSREIVARVTLPSRAREALAGLVTAVEVSRFGGTEPGEADYRACLERFDAFLGSYRGAP